MKIQFSPKKITCLGRRYSYLLIACLAPFFLATSCEKDDHGPTISVVESASEDIVASEGGYISTEGGVSLYIPPSALSSDTRITIEEILVTSEMPWNYLAIVRCLPEGLELQSEATLTMVFEGDFDDDEDIEFLSYYGDNPADFVNIGEYATILYGYSKHASTKSTKQSKNSAKLNTKTPGKTIAAKWCRDLPMESLVSSLVTTTCTRQDIVDRINTSHPGTNLTTDFVRTTRSQLEAAFDTYCDEGKSYGPDDPVDIQEIKDHLNKGGNVYAEHGREKNKPKNHAVKFDKEANGDYNVYNLLNIGPGWRKQLGLTENEDVILKVPLKDYEKMRKMSSLEALRLAKPGLVSKDADGYYISIKTGERLSENNNPPLNWKAIGVQKQKIPKAIKSTDPPVDACEYFDMSRYWCVWYIDNMSLKPVRVTLREDFDKDELCKNYPGGGNDPDLLMEKIMMTDGHYTEEEAIDAACGMFDEVYRLPGSSTFVWTTYLGWIGEERYDCDELGGCGAE